MNQLFVFSMLLNGVASLFLLIAFVCGAVGAVFVLYLTFLLSAAAISERSRRGQKKVQGLHGPHLPCFGIVIPAHNEHLVLEATLQSILKQNYPRDAFEIVVIADNCTDTTAEIAESYGVTVLRRTNPIERGKGYALAWAFADLLTYRKNLPDAWAIIDADTEVAPDFLATMAEYIATHDPGIHYALQGRYGVLNSHQGWRAGLMSAAFDLFNHIRPLGADRLGFLVGLKGNGMVFSTETLLRVPWKGHSITEDIDYGIDLLHADIRIHYVPDAVVRAQMPVTAEQASSQRARWEMGRFQLVREKAFPLLQQAVLCRRPKLAEAALSLTVPPLADLCLVTITGCIFLGLAVLLQTKSQSVLIPPAFSLLSFGIAGFPLYILGGLRLAGAGKAAYIALLCAPFYAIWKVVLYIVTKWKTRGVSQKGHTPWVRTTRIAVTPAITTDHSAPQRKEVSEAIR